MTEFEKLQAIIADVLNVSPETITPDTTFVDDLGVQIGTVPNGFRMKDGTYQNICLYYKEV